MKYVQGLKTVEIQDLFNSDLSIVTNVCHGVAADCGWWGEDRKAERNGAELICLMHSELSEAMEALRKDLNDDHLPHRKGVEVELADCVIRIMDYCGRYNLDLGGAMLEKLAYNSRRADHKIANRTKVNGKKF